MPNAPQESPADPQATATAMDELRIQARHLRNELELTRREYRAAAAGYLAAHAELERQKRELENANGELLDNHRRSIAQRAAIARLVLDRDLGAECAERIFERIAETAAATLGTDRAGVWLLTDDGAQLACATAFEAATQSHAKGQTLDVARLPAYFAHFSRHNVLGTADAPNDPRLRELAEPYLRPHGIDAMIDVGILAEGKLVGFVNAERRGSGRAWKPDEEAFMEILAGFMGQWLANEKRRAAEDALNAANARLQLIGSHIDRSAILLMLWRIAPGRWPPEVVSANVADLLGYSVDDFLSGRISWADLVHPDDADRVEREVAAALDARADDWTNQYRLRAKSGQWVWLEDYNRVIRNAAGRPTHVQAFLLDISRRRRAEEALRHSEEKYRFLVENASDAFFVISPDGTLSYASPGWTRLPGHDVGEVEGQTFHPFIHPDDVPRCQQLIEQTFATGISPRNVEYRAIHKDGSCRWHTANASPIRDAAGRVVAILAVGRDVTERRHAEDALRESEKRHREYLDNSPLAVFVSDESGRYVYANPGASRMTGYSVDELLAMSISDTLFPEDAEAGLLHFQSLLETGRVEGELPFRRKNGERRWWFVTAVKLSETRCLGFCNDVTAQKQAQIALQRKTDELAAKNRHLQCLFEISRTIEEHGDQLPHVLRQAARLLQQALEAPAPVSVEIEVDGGRAATDGTCPAPSLHETCRISANGAKRGEIHVRRPLREGPARLAPDETDLLAAVAKHLGRAIERLDALAVARERQLQLIRSDKLASLGTMVAGVAHEINNPVNNVMLNASLLRDFFADALPILDRHWNAVGDFSAGGLPYSEMRGSVPELLRGIAEASERIKTITGDLRDSAPDQSPPRASPVRINHAVETALRMCSHLDKRFKARVVANLADGLPAVPCHQRRLEQVLINFLQNAWQALRRPDAQIFVETRREGRTVVVEIRDEGCGMPPDVVARVMDPFFTTRRDQGGTGLGLYVSGSIVESMGGRIEFESTENLGTTARIHLPL